MKKVFTLFLSVAIFISLFTFISIPTSASGLLSADELESKLGTVIADINPNGDSCYFTGKNPLSIDYWVWKDNCSWSSHAHEHNEYPPGSGHCAQYIGQCTWYAYGRFLEVYGIALKGRIPNACDWLNVIPSNNADQGVIYSTDVQNPVVGSIFVKNNSSFGHVGFVEGVSDDGNYVYYTDANYNISGSKTNLFDKTDGQVRKKSLESFTKGVVGYIYTNDTALPGDQDGDTEIMHTVVTNNCEPGSVNVRNSPGGSVIGSLFYRDVVSAYPDSITNVDGLDWIKIKYNGNKGYVALKFLRKGIAAQTENIGRALTEAELEDSIGIKTADTQGSKFTSNNPFNAYTEQWYAYGRFAELADINLNNVSTDISGWLSSIPAENSSKGIVSQYGGDPKINSIYITDNGTAGVIEGFSRDGNSLNKYVYYSSYNTGYEIKKAITSDFVKDIKGYIYSHFIPVSQLETDTVTLALVQGEGLTVNATVLPTDASDKSLTWSSANPEIAKVENGRVTAISAGETTVVVTASSGLSKTISVRVFESNIFASDIELSTENLTIERGRADRIIAKVLPENATNKNITYISENPNVATVSSLGIVYAKTSGVTNINIISGDGTVMKKCKVTVTFGQIAWSDWMEKLPDLPEGTATDMSVFFQHKLPDGSWSELLPYNIDGEDYLFTVMRRYELPFLLGDCNFSGKVELSDAMLLFQFVAGHLPDINSLRADMNNDGNISIDDAMLLFKNIAGKI
ncbi:MAG: hypothetical protein DBX47_02700 [Clostridiales bacterium]|nr:MAG: hypothetical protein DBX47_02700 [Clostridiales bacterium]